MLRLIASIGVESMQQTHTKAPTSVLNNWQTPTTQWLPLLGDPIDQLLGDPKVSLDCYQLTNKAKQSKQTGNNSVNRIFYKWMSSNAISHRAVASIKQQSLLHQHLKRRGKKGGNWSDRTIAKNNKPTDSKCFASFATVQIPSYFQSQCTAEPHQSSAT